MSRDPALREESRSLQQAVAAARTLAELRADPEWPSRAPRFARLLGTIRRHVPATADPAPPRPGRVRAVHWNIEHGNWYEQVERALLEHPDLRDADVHSFNEIDLGMARAGNRDVLADLGGALHRHGVWAPMFLETTRGRDDDLSTAGDRENEESLFGLGLLSRWPIGEARIVELPSPETIQFDLERMVGRHVLLTAEILRPGAPFVVATAHLEVHRTRAHRADQIRVVTEALRDERRPVILSGDFNTHTFDRGLWHSSLSAAAVLFMTPDRQLARRFLHADAGAHHESLFDVLRDAGFRWAPYVDYAPTLQVRFERVDEGRAWDWLARLASPVVRWAMSRGTLRLDWFVGRGWSNANAPAGSHGRTVRGLDGPGKASDHAPIVAEFE